RGREGERRRGQRRAERSISRHPMKLIGRTAAGRSLFLRRGRLGFSRMRHPALFALAAVSLISFARRAEGQNAPLDLDWEAPSDCPAGAYVATEVERILSSSPSRAARMRAQGVVSRPAADKWHVELVLRGSEWEAKRALDGPT